MDDHFSIGTHDDLGIPHSKNLPFLILSITGILNGFTVNGSLQLSHSCPLLSWLVVSTPLKNMKVNGKDYPIYEMENNTCSLQPGRLPGVDVHNHCSEGGG